jgi:hypothetical protein
LKEKFIKIGLTFPLIYLDEVPMNPRDDDEYDSRNFQQCLLLRNIIRSMSILAALAGTESSLMNYVEPRKGSRFEGKTLFVKLLHTLPDTQPKALPSLQKYYEKFSPAYQSIIQSYRPLFA